MARWRAGDGDGDGDDDGDGQLRGCHRQSHANRDGEARCDDAPTVGVLSELLSYLVQLAIHPIVRPAQ